MNLSKLSFLFFGIVLMFALSCANPKETVISGKIENADEMTYYLEKIGINSNNTESLLSGKFDSEGKYEIKLPDGIPAGVYIFKIGAKGIEFVVDGSEKDMKISGNLNTIQNREYTIEGSKVNSEYQDIMSKAMSRELDAGQLQDMAINKADPIVGFMIASRIFTFREDFAEVHSGVLPRLKESYPDLFFLNDYTNIVGQLEKAHARKMATAKIKVGMEAPEISLPTPNGKNINLSDYKGKVVLIDFWASWCRPCRNANPHVVEIYQKYKNQGFDILSVSLDGIDDRTRSKLNNDETQIKMNVDRQKERWVAAIEQDKLTWNGHVSDLKKWDSQAAAQYGVTSIPKTFLVGRDGKIVAVDPRNNLEEAVSSAL